MILPFTRDEFFGVFAAYNSAVWPAAALAYLAAGAILIAAWRGGRSAAPVIWAVLSLMWAWAGIVYHGMFFSQINPVAKLFAAAFVTQAVLFGWQAARRRPDFGTRTALRAAAGAGMVAYALIAYPLIGLAAGESYPAMPLFGIAPCPLVIFTLAVMLWADDAPWWLWMTPILWSIIGGSGALLFSVPQDWALPLSALTAMALHWRARPRFTKGEA